MVVNVMPGESLGQLICTRCGRQLGTTEDLDRLAEEAGGEDGLLDSESVPGWAVDRCWRRAEVHCTRSRKWASDVSILLARIVFAFYVRHCWRPDDE
jgi:hypothetical protein